MKHIFLEFLKRLKLFAEKSYYNYLFFRNVEKVGRNIIINGKIEFKKNTGLTVGNNVQLNRNTKLNCQSGVIISNNVICGEGVIILSSLPYFLNKENDFWYYLPGNVIVENNVVLGDNVVLYPGVRIGSNSIIAPNSVVDRDVPKNVILRNGKIQKKGFKSQQKYLRNQNEKISVYEHYHELDGDVIFVFSTGRSGSKSIKDLAKQNPEIMSFHEPLYDHFKIISYNYLANKISREQAKNQILEIYKAAKFLDRKKIFLESDQKLVPFISIISEIFPRAKFIWLIREPKSFLKSAKARGWFSNDFVIEINETVLFSPDHTSDCCRVTGATVAEYSNSEWNALNQDSKILWYWNFWNKLIEKEFASTTNDQMIIKLSELDEKTETFFQFTSNTYSSNWKPIVSNRVKKKDVTKYREIKKFELSKEEIKKAEEYYKYIN